MRIKLDARDVLFSYHIRLRDKRCVFCGRKDGKLECSHFWGRGAKSTRFDPRNANALCFQCHANNEGNKQGFYRTWKLNQLGKKQYDELEKRARHIVTYHTYEKKLILEHLKTNGLDGLKQFLYKLWP